MASPIRTAALIGAAGNLLTGIPSLIPTATDRANKKRLQDLERRAALGQLGLSSEEEAVLDARLAGRSQQAEAISEAERNALLAGTGSATSGSVLQTALMKEEQRARAETENANKIAEANLLKEQAQEEEMAALRAARSERGLERAAALTSVGLGALEGGLSASAQQQYMQGKVQPDRRAASSLAIKYNISEDEAVGLLEAVNKNPDLDSLFNSLLKARGR